MFLRTNTHNKDGKLHRYWNMAESRRTADGRVLQRQVLYLGEINDSQKDRPAAGSSRTLSATPAPASARVPEESDEQLQ
jgi:hypothetical protein